MKTVRGFKINIIDNHKQKYPTSCAPSAVEMVLKLLNKVDESYYDFQDQWNDMRCKFSRKGNKCFSDFQVLAEENIKNIKFTRICDHAEAILGKIERELNSDRYVIISLPESSSESHVWVIYGKNKEGEYIGISKCYNNTIRCSEVRKRVRSKGEIETDILVYDPV